MEGKLKIGLFGPFVILCGCASPPALPGELAPFPGEQWAGLTLEKFTPQSLLTLQPYDDLRAAK